MTVPKNSDFIDNAVTENLFKSNFLLLLDHIRQMTIDIVKFDRITDSDTENLVEFHDKNGNVVLALNKKGQLTSFDEDIKRSILLSNQEDIKEIYAFINYLTQYDVKTVISLFATNDSTDLYRFEDEDGNQILRLTKSGLLRSAQLDGLHNEIDSLGYVKHISKTESSTKLIKFEDLNKNLLGYVDWLGNWVLGGVDIVGEINELKKAKPKLASSSGLKQIAVKSPESIIQIYLTELPQLPTEKGVVISGKGEFHFDGQVFNCYVKIEVQGSSSAFYDKKNWTIGFYSDKALTKAINVKIGDLLQHDELVFKSNWIDHTNIRNAMSYRLWEQIVATRKSYPRLEVEIPYIGKTGKDALQNGATGVPRLYPAMLYINDQFYGIGAFGTGKKRGNYNIAKNKPKEILLELDGWNDITNLEVANPTLYEMKAPSSPNNDTFNAITGWNAFAKLNDADFALQAQTYLHKQNVVDFMIFVEFVRCTDLVSEDSSKNFQFITFNGKQFMFMPYDLDTVFGLDWTGGAVFDNTNGVQASGTFWRKVKATYNAEIEARYEQLRNIGVISVENIYNSASELSTKYSLEMNELELNKWSGRPSLNFTSLEQILNWTSKRIAFLDTYFNYSE